MARTNKRSLALLAIRGIHQLGECEDVRNSLVSNNFGRATIRNSATGVSFSCQTFYRSDTLGIEKAPWTANERRERQRTMLLSCSSRPFVANTFPPA